MTRRAGPAGGHHAGPDRAPRAASGPLARSSGVILTLVTMVAVLFATAMVAPAVTSADVTAPPLESASDPLAGVQFGGTPAIGALFTISNGQLTGHFCTASVVHSPSQDLLVTAAHCVAGYAGSSVSGLVFVPGYADGSTPYGVWTVTRVFVDRAWTGSADPDDDVAFLTVTRKDSAPIEAVTGAERLAIGQSPAQMVRVIGYPASLSEPVTCQNRAAAFSPTQLRFDCANYTNGTSGGPFLTGIDPDTGTGTVIGVIGGYEQGGNSPDVSYAAAFGPGVLALYQSAVIAGP
jgi:V8-like Glu-specific endopeptidase